MSAIDSLRTALDAIPVEQVPAAITVSAGVCVLAPRPQRRPRSCTTCSNAAKPQVAKAILQRSPSADVNRNAKALGVVRISKRKFRFQRSTIQR